MTNAPLQRFLIAWRGRRHKPRGWGYCEHCGYSHKRPACPSPSAIAARCRAIRRLWKDEDYIIRSGGEPDYVEGLMVREATVPYVAGAGRVVVTSDDRDERE
jgi:hypothetical protein